MTSFMNPFLSFQMERVLPFIELAGQSSIQFGPILFSSTTLSSLEKEEDQTLFHSYLQTIDSGKVVSHLSQKQGTSFKLNQMTSLFIHADFHHLSEKAKKNLMMDAVYLFYFSAYFSKLYEGEEVPSFNSFRKMIPASLDFIREKKNWEHLSIQGIDQEEAIALPFADPEICQGLGKVLEAIYQSPSLDSSSTIQKYKRLVRAIRYFVDRLFHRFVNLFDKNSLFAGGAFEVEEIVFLASSFEALFNLNERQSAADFKHQLRSLLHIKYGKPMEMFWKWVDDFYALKQAVIEGEVSSDPIFRLNPNFEISHLLLGTKLLIYSVCHTLFKSELISSIPSDSSSISPAFKWIQSEEVLLFFWTEDNLLRKLNLFIKQARKTFEEELYQDISFLTHLYVFLCHRYEFGKRNAPGVRFIRYSEEPVEQEGREILEQLDQARLNDPEGKLQQAVVPSFFEALERRLEGTTN